jgi:hypothetical protein
VEAAEAPATLLLVWIVRQALSRRLPTVSVSRVAHNRVRLGLNVWALVAVRSTTFRAPHASKMHFSHRQSLQAFILYL